MAYNRLLRPEGLAGETSAPDNAEEDLPPGAGGTYYGGPLANPASTPTPTPGTTSASEPDLPPGAEGTYYGGPFQTPPKPTPTPGTRSAEQDLPPGAEGTYYGGPLANPPATPTPTPSLTTLANGGMNHQEMWLSGVTAPVQQQKFPSNLAEMEPHIAAAPRTPSITPDAIKDFLYGSAFS